MKNLKKTLVALMLFCALTALAGVCACADNELTLACDPTMNAGSEYYLWVTDTDPANAQIVINCDNGATARYVEFDNVNTYKYIISVPDTASGTLSISAINNTNGHSGSKTVSINPSVTVTVSVNPAEIYIALESGQQLFGSTNPAGYPITWQSGNEQVAAVNASGFVTATGKGSTTITASSGGSTATCTVNVYVPVTGVSIDYPALELPVNQWAQLTATVSPENADNKAVTWKSSAPDIVSVDANGIIRRIAEGSATVTATTADGGYTASCVVSSPEPAPTLTITEESIDLTNAARQLKVYCGSSDVTNTCDWASYNTSVVTVSKGVVTPVGTGSTTVSARYSVGGTDKTLYCTVNVNKGSVRLTLSTYNLNLSLNNGNAYLQVYYNGSVIPGNYCTWECTDQTVAAVYQGTVKPLKAGTTYIRAKYNGETSEVCTVTVGGTAIFTITAVSNNATFDGVNPLYFVTSALYTSSAYPTVTIVGANNVYSRNLVYGSDYRVDSSSDGHMMITVNPTTLHNLPQADFHNIAISYGGQIAYARFWRVGSSYNVYGVRTGDDSNVALWGTLCLISFIGATAITVTRRRDIFEK